MLDMKSVDPEKTNPFSVFHDLKDEKSLISILLLIFSCISDSVIITDLDERIIFANEAMQRLYGYSQLDLIGKSPEMLNAEENAEELQNQIRDFVSKNERWKGILKQRRKDGTIFSGEFEVFPVFNSDGTTIAWASILRDITERRNSEVKIRNRKEELKEQLAFAKALNNLAEQIIRTDEIGKILNFIINMIEEILDIDHTIIYEVDIDRNMLILKYQAAKSSLKVLFPYDAFKLDITENSRDFFLNQKITLESHRNDIDAALLDNNFAEFFHDFLGIQSLFWYPFAFSQRGYYSLCFVQLSNARRFKKNELEFVQSAIRLVEIAIQKKECFEERQYALQSLKEKEEKLKEAEKEKELIFSSISEVVIFHDTEMRIKWANAAATEYNNLEKEVLLHKICYEVLYGRVDPCPGCPVDVTLKTGKTYKGEMYMPNGKVMHIKSFPVLDKDGIVIGAVQVSKEITENKKIEKEMARLERLNLIGEMAAGFGHEIRNPMATVRGFLQFIYGKDESYPYRRYFDLMIEEMDRANSIISEFLSLAKHRPIDLKQENLNTIIDTIYPLILADAIHGDKAIELELGDIPDLLIDKKETHQLILNLVRNGLEAMSSGGCLTIKTYSEGDEVILVIRDQGSGIEPEMISKLGIPFVTTKENGTGLGLAICYSIVQRHHAKIEVDSSSNGTAFYIKYKLPSII